MEVEYGSPVARNLYRVAMHLTLIVGAIIFSMPFVWMALTSLKEDDEQMTDELVWIPRWPPARPASPYLDSREGQALRRPQELAPDQWRRLEPVARAALDAPLDAVPVDRATSAPEARELLRAALWRDLARKIPLDKLANAGALKKEIARLATPEQVNASHERIYRAVALGQVTLRAESRSPVLIPVRDDGGKLIWAVAGGSQMKMRQHTYSARPEEELLYDFAAPGEKATVTATVPFDSDVPPKSIAIALKSDTSWNRMWFALEWDGQRYESTEPALLAGTGKTSYEIFYQLPSPEDDDDLRPRYWNLTRKTAGSGYHAQPHSAHLELAFENTTAALKTYDKATFNYKNALRYVPFWRYLAVSVFLVVMNLILTIFSSSFVAYAFARLRWPGREICWAVLLATIMIPGQVTMLPHFLIIKWLGWYNTLRPLWIGSAFGSVFFIFMLRQFMKNIPKDLEDAAKIDGCSYLQIYWHVVMPLVKPTLAAIGIFTFMGCWNDFMGPLMYVTDQRYYPLSLGLFAFQTVSGISQGMLMAASFLMTLPVIALFFLAQKQFIQGVTFTGMKG